MNLKLEVARNELPAAIFTSTFEEFAPATHHYAGILVFGLTPDLEYPAIDALMVSIRNWSAPGSLLWIFIIYKITDQT